MKQSKWKFPQLAHEICERMQTYMNSMNEHTHTRTIKTCQRLTPVTVVEWNLSVVQRHIHVHILPGACRFTCRECLMNAYLVFKAAFPFSHSLSISVVYCSRFSAKHNGRKNIHLWFSRLKNTITIMITKHNMRRWHYNKWSLHPGIISKERESILPLIHRYIYIYSIVMRTHILRILFLYSLYYYLYKVYI